MALRSICRSILPPRHSTGFYYGGLSGALLFRHPGAHHDRSLQLAPETIALIRQLATENPLWGAERIRGELGKLGIRVAKRTIQTYLPGPRVPRLRRDVGRAVSSKLDDRCRRSSLPG